MKAPGFSKEKYPHKFHKRKRERIKPVNTINKHQRRQLERKEVIEELQDKQNIFNKVAIVNLPLSKIPLNVNN